MRLPDSPSELDIISIGECMIEMFCEGPLARTDTYTRTFAGDTMNMLVAASRLGAKTGYVTHVGNDPFQEFLTGAWRAEGIDLRCATPLDRPNGLYFISILPGGEREFTYYRAGSAASFLEPADIDPDYIGGAKVVYASGITQAISKSSRAAVLEAFRVAREHEVATAFDTNLRLGLWSLEEARAALDEIIPYVDILLPSAPEESEALFGTDDAPRGDRRDPGKGRGDGRGEVRRGRRRARGGRRDTRDPGLRPGARVGYLGGRRRVQTGGCCTD